MKRKVIQIADSTQLISLPRKWAIAHNVKKGDELEIEEQGDKVVVSTNKGVSFEKITVDISKLNEKLVHWTLYILHKSGYDEIELTYNDHKIAKVIQDTISEGIMGFEIIEQTPKYCLIKNIATGLESEFETILKRIFLVTISMAKTSYDIISKSQFENLKEIIVLETTNNKLTNFCERLLNQKGYKNITKTSFLYVIVWQFEKIADDFNIPQSVAVLFEMLKSDILNEDKLATVLDFDKVLGLKLEESINKKIDISEEVKKLIEEREVARKDKNWTKSDALRDKIKGLGYEVKDTSDGQQVVKI